MPTQPCRRSRRLADASPASDAMPPCRRSRRLAGASPASVPPPPRRSRLRTAATPPPRPLPVAPPSPPRLLTREVWDIIAGAPDGDMALPDSVGNPAVRIPSVGSKVVYHPYQHTLAPDDEKSDVPRSYTCFVHDVELLADSTTHDLFAVITLGRNEPKPQPPASPPQPVRFFSKRLTGSDVAKERICVGKAGDRLFGTFRPSKFLRMRDVFGGKYVVHRNSYTLINDKGWKRFVHGKGVREGDRVYFVQRGRKKKWVIGVRKVFRPDEVAGISPQDVLTVMTDLYSYKLIKVRLYLGRSQGIIEPSLELTDVM